MPCPGQEPHSTPPGIGFPAIGLVHKAVVLFAKEFSQVVMQRVETFLLGSKDSGEMAMGSTPCDKAGDVRQAQATGLRKCLRQSSIVPIIEQDGDVEPLLFLP
jgi:hypothetical protein